MNDPQQPGPSASPIKKQHKPRGGKRAGAGRPPGKAKKTIERELLEARAEAERLMFEIAKMKSASAAELAQLAMSANAKLGKEVLDEFLQIFRYMAIYYQPFPDGSNQNASAADFRFYAKLAVDTARQLAEFQSPRLAAVMVGQAQTRKIEVVGGLPGPDAPPDLTDEQYSRAMEVIDAQPPATDPTSSAAGVADAVPMSVSSAAAPETDHHGYSERSSADQASDVPPQAAGMLPVK